MNANATLDRKSVRKFFDYKLNTTKIERGGSKPFLAFALGLLVFFFIWLWGVRNHAEVIANLVGTGMGILVTGISIVIAHFVSKSEYKRRLIEHGEQLEKFWQLADETRAVQGADVERAFLRVFDRTQLDRAGLQVFEEVYVLDKERDLFHQESLQERLGELRNKSILFISKGDYSNDRFRRVRWKNANEKWEETFFNPIRLVSLFLTKTQLVICDVQIDSIDGDLREEIQRVSLSKIVNIHFTADRKRFPLTDAQILKRAEDMDYEEDEMGDLRRTLRQADEAGAPQWVHEEMISFLRITRTDGGALNVPVRSKLYFGKHVGALDQKTALTYEEVAVDRMVNELNRFVEHAR